MPDGLWMSLGLCRLFLAVILIGALGLEPVANFTLGLTLW